MKYKLRKDIFVRCAHQLKKDYPYCKNLHGEFYRIERAVNKQKMCNQFACQNTGHLFGFFEGIPLRYCKFHQRIFFNFVRECEKAKKRGDLLRQQGKTWST